MDYVVDGLWIEVYVGEIGDVVFYLFGDGQFCVVVDEVFVDLLVFGWLDVVLQLGYQWQVVGEIVEQIYC